MKSLEGVAKLLKNQIFQDFQKSDCLEMRPNPLWVSQIKNKMIFLKDEKDGFRSFAIPSLIYLFLLFTPFLIGADEADIRLHYAESLEAPEGCVFIPPAGWLAADPSQFPEHLMAIVVGKGKGAYPPSINLWIEPYAGTQKSYLKYIKETCLAEKEGFRDLGEITTESGNAALCQVDRKTKWGEERQLHALIVRYDKAYLLTAAALKEEFADFYPQFFQALRSMKINKSILNKNDRGS